MLKPILVLALAFASTLVARPAAQDGTSEKMTRARALKGLRGCRERGR